MTKQTPKETWDALYEAGIDAEIELVLAMTTDECERELKDAGFDLDEIAANADALFEKLKAMPTDSAETSAGEVARVPTTQSLPR